MRRPGVSPPPTLPTAADATAHAPHAGATCLLPRLHALMLTLHQLLRRRSGLFLARADTRCLYRASPPFFSFSAALSLRLLTADVWHIGEASVQA